MTRQEAIEAALRELMSLPVAQRELAFLDRGIGTATANSVWLRARAALAMPEQGGAREVDYALGQLRHLYSQMVGGSVRYPAEAAKGLLGPAIEKLERHAGALRGLGAGGGR